MNLTPDIAYRPLQGVISWQQHRDEVEAIWRKANKPKPAAKNRSPSGSEKETNASIAPQS